jgi:hypothetical protein
MTAAVMNLGPAIDHKTMQSMEAGAASNNIGVARRLVLGVMAQSIKKLAKTSIDSPGTFDEMCELVNDFRYHASALLEVASSASCRLKIADCRARAVMPDPYALVDEKSSSLTPAEMRALRLFRSMPEASRPEFFRLMSAICEACGWSADAQPFVRTIAEGGAQ